MTIPAMSPRVPAGDRDHWFDDLNRKLQARGFVTRADRERHHLTVTNPSVKGDQMSPGLSQEIQIVVTPSCDQWAWLWAGLRQVRGDNPDPTVEPFSPVFLPEYAAETIARVLAVKG